MNRPTPPLSPLEMAGITIAVQVFMLFGFIGLIAINLINELGQYLELPLISALAGVMSLALFGLLCLCLVRGHFMMMPRIVKGEGRFDPSKCSSKELLLGGLKWGLFCCSLPLYDLVRKRK